MSIDFPKAEVAVIEKWREIKAFERQVSVNNAISFKPV
jgi:isoleucyl-tRNA synthetase